MNTNQYNLEERTLQFSKGAIKFIKTLPRTVANMEIRKQLVKSSISMGSNYIEASESANKKDFITRMKTSRKEAKETIYWLKLVDIREGKEEARQSLIEEATELLNLINSTAIN